MTQVIAYYVPSVLVLLGLLAFWQLAVDFWQVEEYAPAVALLYSSRIKPVK